MLKAFFILCVGAFATLIAMVGNACGNVYWAPGSGGDATIRKIVSESYALPKLLDAQRQGGAELTFSKAVAAERTRLAAIARSYGYLDALVDVIIADRTSNGDDAANVTFVPRLGARYRLAAVEVAGVPENLRDKLPMDDIFALAARPLGEFVRLNTLETLDATIIQRIRSRSYAYAEVASVIQSKDSRTHSLVWQIRLNIGPPVTLGRLVIMGLGRSTAKLATDAFQLVGGEPFDPELLQQLKSRLEKVPQFRILAFRLGDRPGPDGRTDVYLHAEEQTPPWRSFLPAAWPGLVSSAISLVCLFARQIAVASGASIYLVRVLDANILALLVADFCFSARQLVLLTGL
jgi:hypothetical protein